VCCDHSTSHVRTTAIAEIPREDLRPHVTKIDYVLLRPDGTQRIRDQTLDIFSRIFFPIIYAVVAGYFYARAHSSAPAVQQSCS
jgi:hypothetical protein